MSWPPSPNLESDPKKLLKITIIISIVCLHFDSNASCCFDWDDDKSNFALAPPIVYSFIEYGSETELNIFYTSKKTRLKTQKLIKLLEQLVRGLYDYMILNEKH